MRILICPNCSTEINTTKRKRELQAIPAERTDIHMLVTSMYDVQHMRIIFENRFRAIHDNRYVIYADRLLTIENGLKDDLEEQTKLYSIHEWIIAQKGLSFDLAGQLIGIIQDIKRFDNVSKLWAYFGLAVVDVCQNCSKRWYPANQRPEKIMRITKRLQEQHDKKIVKDVLSESFMDKAAKMICSCSHPNLKKTSQKRLKGSLIDYNPTAKMLAYKIGSQFVKQGGLYRELYDQFKDNYSLRDDLKTEVDSRKGKKTKNGESKGTGHIHNMAQRKVVKIFLQHLWVQWRTLEKLPISMPYVIDCMGHSDYIQPKY